MCGQFALCRVGYVPSSLCAELTCHHINYIYIVVVYLVLVNSII